MQRPWSQGEAEPGFRVGNPVLRLLPRLGGTAVRAVRAMGAGLLTVRGDPEDCRGPGRAPGAVVQPPGQTIACTSL
ncbi:hypothetical protein [Streptomyces poriticola]|uniref:hypothetical protein n=1 Tax=Streptomyces poriticola TaxID=3120506 RepID=UPI002FCE16EB